ncbi:MAG: hypothetical protein KAS69_07395 [Planctomycetes bacterium]|nr:hypothetical protein [Planctomycetota bacterium]
MDVSKIKNVMQKQIIENLAALKNYSSLILPIVIILAAVLLFLPTSMISSKLTKRMEKQSASMGKKITALYKDAVSLDQWKTEEQHQESYQKDAEQIALLAKQNTQRKLLSYKIFPKPKGTSILVFGQFGRAFRNAVNNLITQVNGRDCPTAAELNRTPLKNRRRQNTGQSNVDDTILDVLCQEKALSAMVYTNPTDISGYGFWENYEYLGTDKAVEDCWYWQLSYWIIEDVFDTIRTINSSSKNVFTSPVKRLVAIKFEVGNQDSVSSEKAAMYVVSNEAAMTQAYTNRLCNKNIDVVHFSMDVIIDAKEIIPFMQQLCSAKLHKFSGFDGNEKTQTFKHNEITILESKIESIDRESKEHKLYRYGDDAAVKLNLVCEYILNKSGYDEIKPKSVKELLGETTEETGKRETSSRPEIMPRRRIR